MGTLHTSGTQHRSLLGEWAGGGGRTALSAAISYGAGPVLSLTTASVFIKPTIAATGWSTTEVLISPYLAFLFGIFSPLAGRMADRRGVKLTLGFGLIAYAALLVVFALIPNNLIVFYAIAALMGFFGSFGYMVVLNRAVVPWFERSIGKAFGLVGAGGTAMPFVGVPLVAWAVYTWGWHAGYLMLAAFAIAIALPAALIGIVKPKPDEGAQIDLAAARQDAKTEATNQLPDDTDSRTVGDVLRLPRFWVFMIAVFFVSGAANAFLSNMQPILLDGGLTVVVATAITSVFSFGAIAGRLGGGIFLDLFSRYKVAIGLLAISGLGALALTQTSTLPAVLIGAGAILVSVNQGSEGDIVAYFIVREYSRKRFGTIFAISYVATGIGGLAIPLTFGRIVDVTGSYVGACWVGVGIFALGIALLLVCRILPGTGSVYPPRKLSLAPAATDAELRPTTEAPTA